MIIPNYMAFKEGLCSDVEYFQFSYAGKNGRVLKATVKSLSDKHPFYVIYRPLEPHYGHKRAEFKIYDFYHDGYIEKETITEDEETTIPTLEEWWANMNHGGTHFKEYLRFCRDTKQY